MTDLDLSECARLIAELRARGARGQLAATRYQGRLLLRWAHPTGPFSYLLGPDDAGAWGWAMRNTIADPPGAYTAQGDLPAADDPADRAQAIAQFIKQEIDDLNDEH